MDQQWILISGNPVSGFVYEGPFDSASDAERYAERQGGDHCWVAPLAPADTTGEES